MPGKTLAVTSFTRDGATDSPPIFCLSMVMIQTFQTPSFDLAAPIRRFFDLNERSTQNAKGELHIPPTRRNVGAKNSLI
ncbi:hypothetical protein JCM17846_30950 [Iodidimonas nitroreducens]|uniref:Uncharacterized protein n=1 Tax=Iodidimonas nitroreducens TaxID=1236968 RepID=A0A5A7NAJ3_9PROT|nr:hypothetical protein AQ1_00468 [alpha proteobacterium Q-1]GER05413.1 hypothetical protein JCM17846_30950 [Iodidimonas nitroreducens]